jgi:hypothetical protein
MATLSKFQAVRVVAAFAPESEAAKIEAMQAMFFIFIWFSMGVCWSFNIQKNEPPTCSKGIIQFQVTNQRPASDNNVTK